MKGWNDLKRWQKVAVSVAVLVLIVGLYLIFATGFSFF